MTSRSAGLIANRSAGGPALAGGNSCASAVPGTPHCGAGRASAHPADPLEECTRAGSLHHRPLPACRLSLARACVAWAIPGVVRANAKPVFVTLLSTGLPSPYRMAPHRRGASGPCPGSPPRAVSVTRAGGRAAGHGPVRAESAPRRPDNAFSALGIVSLPNPVEETAVWDGSKGVKPSRS